MNIKLTKLALDAHLINYIDHETPRVYFIDGHADVEDVEKFAVLIVQACADYIRENMDSEQAEPLAFCLERDFGLHGDYAE